MLTTLSAVPLGGLTSQTFPRCIARTVLLRGSPGPAIDALQNDASAEVLVPAQLELIARAPRCRSRPVALPRSPRIDYHRAARPPPCSRRARSSSRRDRDRPSPLPAVDDAPRHPCRSASRAHCELRSSRAAATRRSHARRFLVPAQLMAGYWTSLANRRRRSRRLVPHLDVAQADADCYLYVYGRCRDGSLRRENIYPAESRRPRRAPSSPRSRLSGRPEARWARPRPVVVRRGGADLARAVSARSPCGRALSSARRRARRQPPPHVARQVSARAPAPRGREPIAGQA